MRDLEGVMAETGRVIQRRYLLQRLIKQGTICAVYQGTDQVLQRPVAVKIAAAEHVSAYRAALRTTSQFAHPNIIGVYDLIIEPEALYIVQEFVDGDDFHALLQTQLSLYEITDLGIQVCQALLYAGSSSRKVCHGDLTPGAVIRDRRGLVRVNNFALPSDIQYFTAWSSFGGEGAATSDRELPWGQQSDGRRQDDTRAVGLLLYQLLTVRAPGALTVDPPLDGRMHFLPNVPSELTDLVTRTVVRQHPQRISAVETLQTQLKTLAAAFEAPVVVPATRTYRTDDLPPPRQFSPVKPPAFATSLPARERDAGPGGMGISPFRVDTSSKMTALDSEVASPTIADIPRGMADAQPSPYPQTTTTSSPRRLSFPMMLLVGFTVFALFFLLGFLLERALIH